MQSFLKSVFSAACSLSFVFALQTAHAGSGGSGDCIQGDGSGNVRTFFDEARLRSIGTSNGGSGSNPIDGGPGSDELFGLGGPDDFIVELTDHPDADGARDRIWNFSAGDKLILQVNSSNLTALTLSDLQDSPKLWPC